MNITVVLSRDENIKYYGEDTITLDIEEYLKGVVPAEVGNAALECGKAQAVAARTFALYKYLRNGKITDKSSCDQAFRASRLSTAYAKAHQAVEDTVGEVLYYDNKLIANANYAAANGGRTYSCKEVWGTERPYLIAREDEWDFARSKGKKNGHGVGLSQLGAAEAASRGIDYKEILNFYYPGTEIINNYGNKTVQEVTKKMDLSNTAFVEFLKGMLGQPYWYATCCYKCTSSLLASKTKQCPTHYTANRKATYQKAIDKKCVSADCIGLGKGFLWTNGGDGVIEAIGTDKTYTSKYGGNSCPDQSANGMFTYAKSKGNSYGSMDDFPDVPGIAVRFDGHVGYYIGNGEVIEARGFNYGIVKTQLNKRPWTDWYQFPGIDYGTSLSESLKTENSNENFEFGSRVLRVGCSGSDVKELQELLVELDYVTATDGYFNNTTMSAVKLFQKYNNLTVDGIVGKKTYAALKEAQGEDHVDEPQDEIDVTAYPTLRKGDSGEYVIKLQTILKQLNYDIGSAGIDGKFGSKTLVAIKKFQSSKKLKVDGIVGKATWGALVAATS